jgi:hypothetical protein
MLRRIYQIATYPLHSLQLLRLNYIVLPEVEVRRTGTGKNAVLPD